MASAFSICALVVHWRVYIPPGGAAEQNGIPLPDPKWYVSTENIYLLLRACINLNPG
jgi:potassium channel subfamily K